jgi:hypothetical protein
MTTNLFSSYRQGENRGLIDSPKSRVTVVAAGGGGWSEYKESSVYICLPYRSFRPSDHIAFYANKEIQPLVPKVKSVIEAIDLTQLRRIESLDNDHQKKLLKELREVIFRTGFWFRTGLGKIVFLTGPDDSETVKLGGPIANDTIDKNGNPTAFTMGQPRYVTLESLQKARKTSELEHC